MFFYDDLVKKIENKKIKLKNSYSYGLNFRRKAIWLLTGIPLLLMGIFEIYLYFNLEEGGSNGLLFLAAFVTFLGFYNIKMAYDYNLKVDFEKGHLKNKNVDIRLEDVEEVELSRIVPPGSKKLEACISIITKDKKQIIIPLIMKNRVEFAAVLKEYFNEKFKIIKSED